MLPHTHIHTMLTTGKDMVESEPRCSWRWGGTQRRVVGWSVMGEKAGVMVEWGTEKTKTKRERKRKRNKEKKKSLLLLSVRKKAERNENKNSQKHTTFFWFFSSGKGQGVLAMWLLTTGLAQNKADMYFWDALACKWAAVLKIVK